MLADPTEMRQAFSRELSAMYRAEVPMYGELLEIVASINAEAGAEDARVSEERHGAIRVGTPEELRAVRRVFEALGMEPVGYYDLGQAGLPVHSTAFRPVTEEGLEQAPFRVFTSLLRLDALEDGVASTAREVLGSREILSGEAREHLDRADSDGGVREAAADDFIAAALDTFRWHGTARVSEGTYRELLAAHGLVADIVSFHGPHINHLTPRVLDIERAHREMGARGLEAKESIEGPPARDVPVLLRQTAFRALTEEVVFADGSKGGHTARFGEIEQRGAALTPDGMAAYDAGLASGDWSGLPDDWEALRDGGLAYSDAEGGPVTYEDFLPVSAAGIFRSNLDGRSGGGAVGAGNKGEFEAALGRGVVDRFGLYAG